MRLRRLEIENFRGVKSLDWRHIAETAALVGPGDSGKSTLLDAIERVLSPKWNVAFDDTDFWDLHTATPIVIRATITDLAPSFYRDSKFGLLLHAFDKINGEALRASGNEDEDEEHALVVELRVDASLEPVWSVLDADGEKHPFMARDREALGMLRVGGYVDQHLGWSRGSVLTRLTDSGDAIGAVLAEATRQARSSLKTDGLGKLIAAAQRVEQLGKSLGVAVKDALVPHLDASSLSVAAGALSLHDGKVPTRRAGLGTRRLLAIAMQREAAAQSGLTLVDEFEQGLEPHRIRRLLRVLRGRAPEGDGLPKGQLILTTHSPTVLLELDAAEVAVMRRAPDGNVTVQGLPSAVDYILKRTPQALLARKVIVAEGATEVGLCQALDDAWTTESGASFGYRGVVVVDGIGGTQPSEISGHLATLGYEVALLIDSDAKAKTSKAAGAAVLAWPGGLCTEQRLAADLPDAAIRQMATQADERGGRGVRDALADQLKVSRATLNDAEPSTWPDIVGVTPFRSAFGDIAKKKNQAWFKSREQGSFLGGLVAEHWSAIENTPTHEVLGKLKAFAHG